MKAKKKRKNRFKKFVRTVTFTMSICIGLVGFLVYKRLVFKGEVKDKYQSEDPQNNHIVVKTWFGKNDFCVDDDVYKGVEIGEVYSFKKETSVDWVIFRDKQEQENMKDKSEENMKEKPVTEEFKFI